MLFSFNPKFDLKVVAKATADLANGKASRITKAEAQVAALRVALAKYNISEDRVIFLSPDGNTSKYCAESPEIYTMFLNKYKNSLKQAHAWIVRDAGNAYSPGGVSVLESAKVGHEIILPPILHHFFSVNDNKLHTVAKKVWRAMKDHSNDIESSLYLLQALDNVAERHIKGWFVKNFCCETYDKSDNVLTAALTTLISSKATKMEDYHDECLEAYYTANPAQKLATQTKAKKPPKQGQVKVRPND